MPSTIQITELLWTLGGIPGWIIWFRQGLYARTVYQATLRIGRSADRTWARVTLILTSAAIIIETSSIAIGIFGMMRPSITGRISPLGWAVTAHILLVSLAVLVVGILWTHAINALRNAVIEETQ